MLNEHLYIATSKIPGGGKGLFTRIHIAKGELILEYTGTLTTWEKVRADLSNMYLYVIDDEHVIDARNNLKSLGRYANDAEGAVRKKGLENNSAFENIDGKVFIKATKNIAPDSEIFVEYGQPYWDTVKENNSDKK